MQVDFLGKYVWESDIERKLVYVFIITLNIAINTNKKIEEGRFCSRTEINRNLVEDILTPDFEYELKLFGKLLKNNSKIKSVSMQFLAN